MDGEYDKEVEETVLIHTTGMCQELNPWINSLPS